VREDVFVHSKAYTASTFVSACKTFSILVLDKCQCGAFYRSFRLFLM
jgi:hypothetical protein